MIELSHVLSNINTELKKEIPLDRTILIYQKDSDNELTRYSISYSTRSKNQEVAKVLVEKGFLATDTFPDEYRLTMLGCAERAKAEKRLESNGR
jgi:hypothetical protein|tara:strand:- start:958 stop:1239 length:282 start_codon:yes stop_codon:yes gene_type:complete